MPSRIGSAKIHGRTAPRLIQQRCAKAFNESLPQHLLLFCSLLLGIQFLVETVGGFGGLYGPMSSSLAPFCPVGN
jgi:hypothetical protein